MKKKSIVILFITLFLVAVSGSAFAWSPRLEGKPDQFRLGATNGYYIWHDNNGFHILTTARGGEEHTYTGTIRTDGDIFHLRGNKLERGDSLKEYNTDNRRWFDADSKPGRARFQQPGRDVDFGDNAVKFRFNTTGGSDGLDFRIKDAKYVEFDLYIDGRKIGRKHIFIGDDGWHPSAGEFKLRN